MSQLIIRPVRPGDEAQLVPLMHQLGYPTSAAVLAERIVLFAGRADDHAMVADAGGEMLGCIALHLLECFHAPGRLGRITALVVDERCRGQGVGAVLVAAGEAWLRERGCERVELTSNAERTAAHRFYQTQGYANDSLRFVKPLAAPAPHPH